MKLLIVLGLFICTSFASGTQQRGEEAQKLANAMGAQLDMSGAQRATDQWKATQTEYEQTKADLYKGVNQAYESANKLKDDTEKLEAAKDKKNVEDSKLEQTAVNYLAMQMIKERKATKDMSKERDEALVYVPKLKKHQAEQMQSLKDAAVAEAKTLNERIVEEQKRRTEDVNQKIGELDELQQKMDAAIQEEKGRTAAAVQEGQDNVEKARAEFAEERNQLVDQINKLNEQNKQDLAVKDDKIKGLENTVEEVRQQGVDAVAAEKAQGEQERKAQEDKYQQELTEKDNSYKAQIAGINQNLEQTQGEVNDLQGKLVENNAASQQAQTEMQKNLDAQISALKEKNKEKLAQATQRASEDKAEAISQLQQTADSKVAQTEANAAQRIENLKASNEKVVTRITEQKERTQGLYEEEQKLVDETKAKLRKAVADNVEMRQIMQDQNEAAQQAAKMTNFAIPAGGNSLSVANNELTNEIQVASPGVAPINMKFVGVLVAVNALLGCVAFTYYSESKKLQSFQATFLEEF